MDEMRSPLCGMVPWSGDIQSSCEGTNCTEMMSRGDVGNERQL